MHVGPGQLRTSEGVTDWIALASVGASDESFSLPSDVRRGWHDIRTVIQTWLAASWPRPAAVGGAMG